MNKNIAYVLSAVIVIALVGWFAYSQLAAPNTEKSANEQASSANSEQAPQDPATPNDTKTADADPASQNGPCTSKFTNSMLSQTTVSQSEKFVTLSVKGFGDIKIEVDYANAPKSSENFVKLAKSGFYDCLIFHRVIPGFVAQGGDPKGDGSGGPGYTIPAEIKLLHTKYSIAMARLGDEANPKRESSGSQFYISLEALPMLDGQYTVFGKVVSGQSIVDKLGKVQTGPMDRPLENVEITKATVSDK